MPPFGRMPSSRNCGLRKNTVSGVPSLRLALVEPLPRSHSAMCSSSNTIVPPRGVTCAKPLGSTEPTRHTFAGNAVLMCGCNTFGIFAMIRSPAGLLRYLVEGRADIAGCDPAQVARLALVEWPAAMHRATIVPDYQITLTPFVAIHELVLGRMFYQLAQQEPPVGHRPADDFGGMRGEIKRPPAGARMGAHQPLRHRRQYILFAEQQLGKAKLRARPGDVVQRDEILDLDLSRLRQRIVG